MKKTLVAIIVSILLLPTFSMMMPRVFKTEGAGTTLTVKAFDESGFPPASSVGFQAVVGLKTRIYDSSNTFVASGQTGDDGSVTFNLSPGTYLIKYGECLARRVGEPLTWMRPSGPGEKKVTVVAGTNEINVYFEELSWHVYQSDGDGGNPFQLDYLDLSSATPEHEYSLTVTPGQTVNAIASFWELETVNVPVWWASIYGEWQPTAPLANLAMGGASPSSHNLHTVSFTFTAPTIPGTYHIRLNGVLDYDWPVSYYTGIHPNPNLGRDMGNSIISNININTATGDVTGTYGIGTIVVASPTPSIESVILNRNPAVTTHWAFQLSAPPAEYSATMPGLGVWAAVTISNPTSDEFKGRLRVFFKDPNGNENEHFALASNAILVDVPEQSSSMITVPIYGTGIFGGDTGTWTIRFVLGQGVWYNWITIDEKTTQLLVTPNNPIDGPKHHGITVPISEFLTAKKPSITDLALEALNLGLQLAWAKGSTDVDASGVHPRAPESIKDILPGTVATTDLSIISHALDTSTFLKANSHKITTNTYSLSFKTFLNPTTIETDNGEYTFDPSYDRIRLIVNLPAGVVVTDKGDALEAYTDSSGGTTVYWIDNYCDKLFNGLSSKTHQITVQVNGGATYSVQAHAYFEIGPLGQEPKSGVFPVTDYNKWNSDPANVYWIEMTTKEDTLNLKGK